MKKLASCLTWRSRRSGSCVGRCSSAELTKYWTCIHELNPQRGDKSGEAFQFLRATKRPLRASKGAKLGLTGVIPCGWKRISFVINEVTNSSFSATRCEISRGLKRVLFIGL